MKRYWKSLPLVALIVSVFLIAGFASFAEAKRIAKIAFLAPFTGPNASIGIGSRNTIDLAIKQANRSGEFKDYEIQLMALDDASSPEVGVAAAERACADPDVIAGIGHFNSPVALATIHVFHRYGVSFIIYYAIHPDITYGHNYKEIFRVIQIMSMLEEEIAERAVNKFNYKKWSLIHDVNSLGEIHKKEFMNSFPKRGAQVLSIDGVSSGQVDFMPVLTKIKNLKPEAVYYGGVVMEAALIKSQMNKLGMTNVLLTSGSGIMSETYNEIAKGAAEGTMVFFGQRPTEKAKGGKEFIAAYKAEGYKEPFESGVTMAYDSANIILTAMKKAGLDKEALIKEISAIRYDGSMELQPSMNVDRQN